MIFESKRIGPKDDAAGDNRLVKAVIIILALAVALFVLDRLLLAAERRGWIYWRKSKASPGTVSTAMMELHSMVEPGRAHVVEAMRAEDEDEDDLGDDVESRGGFEKPK